MGIYDRDYNSSRGGSYGSSFSSAPQMHMRWPSVTPYVKKLLIINIAVHFVTISPQFREFIWGWFALNPATLGLSAQIWRLVSYQFLHADFWHILMNMLGLFFLGPTLERAWGSKKFLSFYLGCGIAGGLFYMLLVAIRFLEAGYMVGASGAIFGMLAACAILFPHFVVFLFFFPVPIRVAAVILIFISTLFILTGPNAGGHAAHLAGMAAGAAYVISGDARGKMKMKFQSKNWQKKMTTQTQLQEEVDRILDKVHNHGIQSLNRREKKILKKATEAEQGR